MNMQNISPKAEPVTWGVVVAALVSALVSYNVSITDELAALLVLIAPFIGAALIARFRVYAPDTVQEIGQARYQQGLHDAQPTETPAPPRRNVKPSEGVARYTRPGA